MIIEILRSLYGLNVEVGSVEQLPLGADVNASVYRAYDKNGECYFIKERWNGENMVNLAVVELLEKAGVREILIPVRTRDGKLSAHSEDKMYIVYPFIKGTDGFSKALTKEQWIVLGKALRKVHGVKVSDDLGVSTERYSDKWQRKFRSIMANEGCAHDDVGKRLWAFIQERRDVLEKLVERAEALGQKIKKDTRKNVLCHSDLHGGNVLIDEKAGFYIVDWDETILAPKEKDLLFIGGGVGNVWNKPEEEEWFYAGYGKVEIDRELLAYFRFERIVKDVVEFCEALFGNVGSPKEREVMLGHFAGMFAPNGVVEIAFRTDVLLG